jgi:hypothetical protein
MGGQLVLGFIGLITLFGGIGTFAALIAMAKSRY